MTESEVILGWARAQARAAALDLEAELHLTGYVVGGQFVGNLAGVNCLLSGVELERERQAARWSRGARARFDSELHPYLARWELDGEVRVLPIDAATADEAAELVGDWCREHHDLDEVAVDVHPICADDIVRMRGGLAAVEWAAEEDVASGGTHAACPACGGYEPPGPQGTDDLIGHDDKCPVRRALHGAGGEM